MARESQKRPESHFIEAAESGCSACQTCEKPIAAGELRLAEVYVGHDGKMAASHRHLRHAYRPRYEEGDDRPSNFDQGGAGDSDVSTRFHHLACAVAKHPYMLRAALRASTVEVPERAALEAAIEKALSAGEATEGPREYQEYLDRLVASPEDVDAVLVFADWLQSVGDPRGDLIVLQSQLEHAVLEEAARLKVSEARLLGEHRHRFLPERCEGEVTWRLGFVQRLKVRADHGLERTVLGRVFAHPSFRLLRELVVDLDSWSRLVVTANLPQALPPSLTTIDLGAPMLGRPGPLLAGLPMLRGLKLAGHAELDDLAHPALATLELCVADATEVAATAPQGQARSLCHRLGQLSRERLPSVTSIGLHARRGLDAAVAALAESSIAEGLRTVRLTGDLTQESVAALEQLAARGPLEILDLPRDARIPVTALEGLSQRGCAVLPDGVEEKPPPEEEKAPSTEWLVRHIERPEWGIGRVISEDENGLKVEFERAGVKLVRTPDFLEDV